MTVVLGALTLVGVFLPEYESADYLFVLGVLPALFIALTLWFLWRGHDWARVLVLLGAGLVAIPNAVLYGLLDLSIIGKGGLVARCIYVGEGILAPYLIYYLNRPALRAYFKGH